MVIQWRQKRWIEKSKLISSMKNNPIWRHRRSFGLFLHTSEEAWIFNPPFLTSLGYHKPPFKSQQYIPITRNFCCTGGSMNGEVFDFTLDTNQTCNMLWYLENIIWWAMSTICVMMNWEESRGEKQKNIKSLWRQVTVQESL